MCVHAAVSKQEACSAGYFREFSRGIICKEVDREPQGQYSTLGRYWEESYSLLLRPEGTGSKVETQRGGCPEGSQTLAEGLHLCGAPPITKSYGKASRHRVQVMLPTPGQPPGPRDRKGIGGK